MTGPELTPSTPPGASIVAVPVSSPTFGGNLVSLLIGLVVLLAGGVTVLALLASSLHTDVRTLKSDVDRLEVNQEQGKVRTYRSQALSCSIKLAIGGDVSADAACQTPEVLALYDEHALPVVTGVITEGDGG